MLIKIIYKKTQTLKNVLFLMQGFDWVAVMGIVKAVCKDDMHVPDVEFILNRCSLRNIHLGTAVIFETNDCDLVKMVEYIGKAKLETPSKYDLREFGYTC